MTATITDQSDATGYLNIVHRTVQFSEYQCFAPRQKERVWRS